jgi:hypothetical protein
MVFRRRDGAGAGIADAPTAVLRIVPGDDSRQHGYRSSRI